MLDDVDVEPTASRSSGANAGTQIIRLRIEIKNSHLTHLWPIWLGLRFLIWAP
jgi:hypothetical protein